MPEPIESTIGRFEDTTELVDPLTLRQGYDRRAESAERTDRGSRLRGWNPARSQSPPRRDLVPPEQRQRPLVPPVGGPDLTPRQSGPPPSQPLLRPVPPTQRPRPALPPGRPPGQPDVSGEVYGPGSYPTGANGYPTGGNGYSTGVNGYAPGTNGYGPNGYGPNGYGANGYDPGTNGFSANGYPQNGSAAAPGDPSGFVPTTYLPPGGGPSGHDNGRRGPGTEYGSPPGPDGYPTTYIPRGNGTGGYPEAQYSAPPQQWPGPPVDPYQTGYVGNMPTTGVGQPASAPPLPDRIERYQTDRGWVGTPGYGGPAEVADRPFSAPGQPAAGAYPDDLAEVSGQFPEATSGVGGAYGPGPRQIGHPRPARVAEITGSTAVVRVQAVDAFGEEDADLDDAIPAEGGYLSAALATLGWYSVPAVLYIAYAFYLGGAVRPGCVSVNGGACLSPRAVALNVISNNIGLIAIAFVLSTVIAIMLRWATTGWRSLAIGFAAAVVGGGATTVLITTFNGGG